VRETVVDPRFANRERQPGLDLLRALAIILVVIYHAGIFGFTLPHRLHRFGWIGVDLFFVLSGYLIGGQLLAPLARKQPMNLPRFFSRRALREFPEISPLWKFLISIQNINLRGGTAFSHAWSLAIEDQFYLALPLLLIFINGWNRAAFIIPLAVFIGGLALRGTFAYLNPGEAGVSFSGFQKFIYYPTWTRLDPLVFGVVLAALEKFRPSLWNRLMNFATWLWLPGLAAIAYGLALGENDLTIATCVWQFPLIAVGMATLLVCAVSPRLPFRRVEIPGAAFFASIAYSVYLSHKLIIHAIIQFCSAHNIALTSVSALLLVEICIYGAGLILFLSIERPFLQLRRRIAH